MKIEINENTIDYKLHRITFLCGQLVNGPIIKINLTDLVSSIYEIMQLVKEIAVMIEEQKP